MVADMWHNAIPLDGEASPSPKDDMIESLFYIATRLWRHHPDLISQTLERENYLDQIAPTTADALSHTSSLAVACRQINQCYPDKLMSHIDPAEWIVRPQNFSSLCVQKSERCLIALLQSTKHRLWISKHLTTQLLDTIWGSFRNIQSHLCLLELHDLSPDTVHDWLVSHELSD